MLVICCGMLRSGSTLQYNIAVWLALATRSRNIMGYGLWDRFSKLYDLAQKTQSLVVVKEHNFNPKLLQCDPRLIRIIYSYRDVRDALVSMYQKNGPPSDDINGEWERKTIGYLKNMITNYERWVSIPGIHKSRYEIFSSNIIDEICAIAQYLGVTIDAVQANKLLNAVSIESHSRIIKGFDYNKKGIGPNNDRFDPVSQLHQKHLNGGKVGKWRDYFSHNQLSFINSYASEWLRLNGYEA